MLTLTAQTLTLDFRGTANSLPSDLALGVAFPCHHDAIARCGKETRGNLPMLHVGGREVNNSDGHTFLSVLIKCRIVDGSNQTTVRQT